MNRFQKNKNLKALVLTLIIVAVMGVFSMGDNSVIASGFGFLTRGLFQLSAAATASLDSASDADLRAENETLREENAALRGQLADYYALKEENERLWSYYGLKKENPSYDIKPANVIRRDAGADFYAFTLDVGSTLGVKVNDPVITENGLVGRVSRVDGATCTVSTILSPDTKVGAIDSQSNDSGVVSGSAALCDQNRTSMNQIPEDHKIQAGDMVVTAGAGGVYPKGLIIGKVVEVGFNAYDTSRYAVVEPYEDIGRITSAAVITGFATKGEVQK